MDSITNFLLQILPVLVDTLALPLTILVGILVVKLLKKVGVDETSAIEALVTEVVNQGVKYAEQEAAKLAEKGDLADSGTKMELATTFILAQIESLGLAELASDELVRRIEAAVGEMNNS